MCTNLVWKRERGNFFRVKRKDSNWREEFDDPFGKYPKERIRERKRAKSGSKRGGMVSAWRLVKPKSADIFRVLSTVFLPPTGHLRDVNLFYPTTTSILNLFYMTDKFIIGGTPNIAKERSDFPNCHVTLSIGRPTQNSTFLPPLSHFPNPPIPAIVCELARKCLLDGLVCLSPSKSRCLTYVV